MRVLEGGSGGGDSFPLATAACLALGARLLLWQEALPPGEGGPVVWGMCAPHPVRPQASSALLQTLVPR